MTPEFRPFPKVARLSREVVITEKIDGVNASILISETTDEERGSLSWEQQKIIAIVGDLTIRAGSRTRWITPDDDNCGFAAWVNQNRDELVALGIGHHFGEWWGSGIWRGYGMAEKRWSLFNVLRWHKHGDSPTQSGIVWSALDEEMIPRFTAPLPPCCHLVPVLWRGVFDTCAIDWQLDLLRRKGSSAAPGFMNPEGVITFHIAGNVGFKKTLKKDNEPKTA